MQSMKFDKNDLKTLYLIGAVSSVLQLAVIVIYMMAVAILGSRITGAEEFFLVQQSSTWLVFFRVDFMLLILVGLYLGNFPSLLVSLWRTNPAAILFAFMFTIIAVVLSFSNEATFALFHLGKQYAAAGSDMIQAQIIASGEGILANGWWHSTGSYMAGILLQGSGIMVSAVMLRSNDFSKITGIAGLIGNGFDLSQHLIHPFMPEIARYLSFAMAAYLLWFPMLARDLFALAGNQAHKHR